MFHYGLVRGRSDPASRLSPPLTQHTPLPHTHILTQVLRIPHPWQAQRAHTHLNPRGAWRPRGTRQA